MRILFLIPLLLLFTFLIGNPLFAARKINIASIGVRPNSNGEVDPAKLVAYTIQYWESQIKQILASQPDLIVLPEVCDLPMGLSPDATLKYLKYRKNQILEYFGKVAKANNTYLSFSYNREMADGSWRNSFILLDRKGEIVGIYDKYFPTIGEMEKGIKAGNKVPVFECDFGRVAMAVCFDLNFTELLYQFAAQKPDIVLFSSLYHGGLMQSYWAYTCRSFFVGSMGFKEIPCQILNPLGEIIASSTNYFNFVVATVNLDAKLVHLDFNWRKLTQLKAKYGNQVEILDPGRLGAVLITSHHEQISALDMINEFEIELLDDYFERVRTFRELHTQNEL